ncbi:ATP-binding protein [Catellatospora methionotrophica]|uniref:ATP-binding protein n=1 Tax=Catellatospora methionotrophica TaxID=121620 RepID=UPI0033F7EDA0
MPKFLDDMRQQVAAASGITASDLPFLAELIDVPPEQARWRVAVETVLGASARLLLIPKDRFEHFSQAVNPLPLRGRLTFEAVELGLNGPADGDPERIFGKLIFKDSPFTGWVRRHLAEPVRNARCVEDPQNLAGHELRVTLAGQTRLGTRGSHGRNDQSDIIGFSNEHTIAAIDRELKQIEDLLKSIDREREAFDEQLRELDRRRAAYEAITATTWEDIDVATVDRRIEELDSARRAILGADDQLQELQRRIDQLGKTLEAARERKYGLKKVEADLKEAWSSLTSTNDAVRGELDRLATLPHVLLDDVQAAALDAHFAAAVAPADPDNWEQFPTHLARLRQRLVDAAATARGRASNAESELERVFSAYQLKFEDPNLGRTAASYPDYARILQAIVTTGLHERREEWRQRLMKWSGEDLVPLSGAIESSIEEIEERLDPINDILGGLPFGANRDRLRIRLRRLAPDAVIQFRKQLRQLSSGATRDLREEQMEARFRELQQFMARIRRRDDPRAITDLSDRDRLLDVRRHVEITAERYDSEGQLLSTHSSLGGKSGGESQELVAFIVGAALRFRLGDELRLRPRFAPVFLDEGFVKSDSEFAGRAVQAWRGLGFQLIVGAPLDKVTALEPHMDELLAITKNTSTHYSFVARISDTGRRPAVGAVPTQRDSTTAMAPAAPGSTEPANPGETPATRYGQTVMW